MEYRIEHDTLGKVKVPRAAYYGAQTQRAVQNFPVSGLRLPPTFVRAQAIIKLAAAKANMVAGNLDPEIGEALVAAAKEVMEGRFDNQFVVDVFQAGAGTSQNMNINEILANRANELLGGELGKYDRVHPNDHANMAQSTNDTIHASIHIAAVCEMREGLAPQVARLAEELGRKAAAFDHIVKAGRTHLQDAAPVRLGQEFGAYARMIRLGQSRIEAACQSLLPLCIGGTAVGTGLNTDPGYRKNAIAQINEATGYTFTGADNLFEAMQGMDAVVETAGALRVLVTSLRKIADDLRLLGSGPRTGLAEIHLPTVQPGSSIMPGKVNPVMAEMLDMVCLHCLGCDTAIVSAAQAGQLELNVMMPVIAYNLLQEIAILTGGIAAFTSRCIEGIEANEEACQLSAERSLALATALNPAIGYEEAAKLAKEALSRNVPIRDLARKKGILDDTRLAELLDLKRMTEDPGAAGK
ncbi:MAG: class II fumarate hydratase [Phycisphaerales bacterium]|nr:MAG: class II fumarate hydratase [Phycisphaerales bacterium]